MVLYCGEDLDAAALRQNAVDKFDVKILREIQVLSRRPTMDYK